MNPTTTTKEQTLNDLKNAEIYINRICAIWDRPQYFNMMALVRDMIYNLSKKQDDKELINKYLDCFEILSTLNYGCFVSAYMYDLIFNAFYGYYGYAENGQKKLAINKFDTHLNRLNN